MKNKNTKIKKNKYQKNQDEVKNTCKISVPRDLENSFISLIQLIPSPYRHKKDVQQTVLKYLKLGGEELVRIVIESSKEEFSQISGKKLKRD
jgi:hypothetical protein